MKYIVLTVLPMLIIVWMLYNPVSQTTFWIALSIYGCLLLYTIGIIIRKSKN
jgi:hypothetical protein